MASVAKMCAELVARYDPHHALDLTFDQFRVRVRSNSTRVINQLQRYYADYLAVHDTNFVVVFALQGMAPAPPAPLRPQPPSPGKSRIKEEFVDLDDGRVATRTGTGMMFLRSGTDNVVIGPCLDHLNRVVDFVNFRYCQWHVHQGAVLFHVAGVELGGQGLALAGFPSRGKSTLALHLMNAGARFVTNDRALVRRDNGTTTMHGIAKSPRINPGTIVNNPSLIDVLTPERQLHFQEMPTDQLWQVEDKFDLDVSQHFGPHRRVSSHSLNALIILNWHNEAQTTRLQRVDLGQRDDLWPTFTKSLGLFCDAALEQNTYTAPIDQYLSLLASVQIYELTGGVDFDTAVAACVDLVRQ